MADERTSEERQVALESAKADLDKKLFDFAQVQRKAFADLVPDLSKVERGTIDGADKPGLFQGLLGGQALKKAAAQVRDRVQTALGRGLTTVLLTTDPNWAAREAEYKGLLAQLRAVGDQLKAIKLPQDSSPPPSGRAMTALVGPLVGGLVTGLIGQLPALLSLAATRRTIATSTGSVDDQLTLYAVAGALAAEPIIATVIVDGTQSLKVGGDAQSAWNEAISALELAQARLDARQADEDEDWFKLLQRTLASSSERLLGLASPPPGGALSVLDHAALYEALKGIDFEVVVIVKGGAADYSQLLSDRAIKKDLVSIVTSATISYLVVDARTNSRVRGGGLEVGTAQAHGQIGSDLPNL